MHSPNPWVSVSHSSLVGLPNSNVRFREFAQDLRTAFGRAIVTNSRHPRLTANVVAALISTSGFQNRFIPHNRIVPQKWYNPTLYARYDRHNRQSLTSPDRLILASMTGTIGRNFGRTFRGSGGLPDELVSQ